MRRLDGPNGTGAIGGAAAPASEEKVGATASKDASAPKDAAAPNVDTFLPNRTGMQHRYEATFAQRHANASCSFERKLAELKDLSFSAFDHVSRPSHPTMCVRPGAGAGLLTRSPGVAEELRRRGVPYVLVMTELTPETAVAGAGASALVVPDNLDATTLRGVRALGTPTMAIGHQAEFWRLNQGDTIADVDARPRQVTIDATGGRLHSGEYHIVAGSPAPDFSAALGALRSTQPDLTVTAEACTVKGIAQSVALGADAIRIDADALLSSDRAMRVLRHYLLATEAAPRMKLLEELTTLVSAAASDLLQAANGAGTTFAIGTRSPASYFPLRRELLDEIAAAADLPAGIVAHRVEELGAGNSKLGLRGARWAVKEPALFEAIARGIFEAQARRVEDERPAGELRLLIPSVSLVGEAKHAAALFEKQRAAVEREFGCPVPAKYGAGIETASGSLNAAGIAEHVQFLEYSLPELTETLYGISQDDASTFLPKLVADGIYPQDPFIHPDIDGVGKMVRVAQYIAGAQPNAFPATIRGAQLLGNDGLLLAEECGIRNLSVGADHCLDARIAHARMTVSLDHAQGLARPQPEMRDQSLKLFDLLTDVAFDGTAPVKKAPAVKIPDGTTPLEHLEGLASKVASGTMTTAEALLAMPTNMVDLVGRPVIDPKAKVNTLSKSIGASPGCGAGKIALSKAQAEQYLAAKEPYILVLNEVAPDEADVVRSAKGLISVRGGASSHAAMVAQNAEVPCVMNEKVSINVGKLTVKIGNSTLNEGDTITIDGIKGTVMTGQVPMINPSESPAFSELMAWADEHRRLHIYANADRPQEAIKAFKYGAEGIGLVRSEHMFIGERSNIFNAMILSNAEDRPAALAAAEEMQFGDYAELFRAAEGRKVEVRLIDPPLYEFVPKEPGEVAVTAAALKMDPEEVARRATDAKEVDSLLGLRGARLTLVKPEIEATQVRALARAYAVEARAGRPVAALHITVPMISTGTEMEAAAKRIRSVLAEVEAKEGMKIPLVLGAMIETPRAALDAAEIARHSDYFSYGTNDLTMLTLGFGRNVATKFVPELVKAGAIDADPTMSLDPRSVVQMMKVTEALGRDQASHLVTGICGNQGSDPASVQSCEDLGVDYVSVPPGQVNKARFAAAQAALKKAQRQEPNPTPRLLAELERSMATVQSIPTSPAQHGMMRGLEHELRKTGRHLDKLRRSGDFAAIKEALPLFDRYARARAMLDLDRILKTAHGDHDQLRLQVVGVAGSDLPDDDQKAARAALGRASEALGALSKAATDRVNTQKLSSATDGAIAGHALAVLRAHEEARTIIGRTFLTTERDQHTRFRHRNDGWDNRHYTRTSPDPTKPMGTYLKAVAQEFLDDNGLQVEATGLENIPKDKPVVYAVSHRSGAIDRFITNAALPMDDDKFMYLVRAGSPLHVRAQEAYGDGNKWILPTMKYDALLERIRQGFADGAKTLLTYPEGTGTVSGEPRYVASSTIAMAQVAGAVVVPVVLQDPYQVEPFKGGVVQLRAKKPIDLTEISRGLGLGSDDKVVTEVAHALLQFDLGSEFRSLL